MKPALLEVMRMNRICRMVLATCLGSFILVIFYFQSMLHPGRGRVSVVLLDIFFSLALSLARPAWFLPLPTLSLSLGYLGAPCCCPGLPGSPTRDGEEGEDVLSPLPPSGYRLEHGIRRGGSFFFLSFFSFLFLCVSCLSACQVAGPGRDCGKRLGVEGLFEENSAPSGLRPKSENERGVGSRPPCARARCLFLVGGPGAKGARPSEVASLTGTWGARGQAPPRVRRSAQRRLGKRLGAPRSPSTQLGKGAPHRLFAPGVQPRTDLVADAWGLLQHPPTPIPISFPDPALVRAPGSRLGHRSFGGNFGRVQADRQVAYPTPGLRASRVPRSPPGRVGVSPLPSPRRQTGSAS